MHTSYLLKYMIPEVSWVMEQYKLPDELFMKVKSAKDVDEAWGAFLSDTGKIYANLKTARDGDTIYIDHNLIASEMAIGICARLKFSKSRAEAVIEYVRRSS